MADGRPGFLALPRAIFASSAWKEKRQFSTFEAMVDLAGLASFSAREYDYKGTMLHLELRETPPLSVRFLMQRWGWKSTATVSRFVADLMETGGLVQNSKRNTERNTIPNTYFVGRCILACISETPNETSIGTPNETKEKKDKEEGLKKSSLPTEEKKQTRARGSRKVPAEWSPDAELEVVLRAIAAQRGADYDEQMVMLRDHEFPRPYHDWPAVARNWFRNSRPTIGAANGNGRHGRGDGSDWRRSKPGDSHADDPLLQG